MTVHNSNGHTNGGGSNTALHVVIVGAGLGGLSAAISCSLAGHKVTVLEQAAKLGEVGAGIQLTPNVTRLLRSWGVYDELRASAVEPHNIWFRRWQTGEAIGVTHLVPNFAADFGAPYWVVHRAHLHEALVERAHALGATIHVKSRIESIDFDVPSVTTTSGLVVYGDLILGCDGLKSVTRRFFLNGNDSGPKETQFCAYRSTVPMDALLGDPELRPLVEKPDLHLWIGPERHVMSYPISGGKTFNMVLSHPHEGPIDPTATQEQLIGEMRNNYEGWDPKLTKIISLIDKTNKWKLMGYERLKSWVHPKGTYVILGDACHAMLPYMSQGAAMAMEDAAALGRVLARASSPKDLPTLTKLFAEIRMDRAYEVQARSALNGRIWHYPDGEDQVARDAGMAATLTGEHYIRSTNQWSDPSTQLWLYNHDAEGHTDLFLDTHLGTKGGTKSGVREMREKGLLA
ncbi:hypothetical protein CcaverHIS002_0312610 [Cutaneotrichosporon cavernicola]|uniref:FAD-binding domain-containing protein n=1 Tax=Cutaneotrichosporon cavernicola TaxID=279322 RepID=A0AA48L3B7_9TREE|nr:uncharacterized protein CcaverHIS019_0312470 [Cutaneotrichosporon cavernicola]BEI83393.1 hypothetical protein CcaverHIS002_0312610 [Cutaneotrichosporon cavernicola]BEI91177.1 hypothetical protein CcaverHIS019_0312470 [Cutaneotrichosporon cavernicola]BEI98954.1 hypothetical protein CcaverHIS631_0312530 [Cutaneotrichosporon cavernicola]BEJ06728.1 hypothetical protein CcaverHIS641_0312500 [Cutaneotrichosporon cavernicola]